MDTAAVAYKKARDYIQELEDYIKDNEHEPSVWVPTWDEEGDRKVTVHYFYIFEVFALKYTYENLLKELQKEIGVDKLLCHGCNGEGIVPSIQIWKDAIEIMQHKNLSNKAMR